MTDILFGQSYYLRFDPKLWEAMQPYPPQGTLYAAAYMRKRGYSVALFDAMLAESTQEWATALKQYQPKYAVLFETGHFIVRRSTGNSVCRQAVSPDTSLGRPVGSRFRRLRHRRGKS